VRRLAVGKEAAQLRAAGYDVRLVTLPGAKHLAPIFHELADGKSVVASNDRAGERVVEIVTNAIGSAATTD
jgi:hypothetical protein